MEQSKRVVHITVHAQLSDPDIELRVHVVKSYTSHMAIHAAQVVTGVTADLITGGSRKRHLVDVRKMVSRIMKDSGMTYQGIGSMLNVDHSAIVQYLEKHEQHLQYDVGYKSTFNLIHNQFKTLSNGNPDKTHHSSEASAQSCS